jgi:membrane associated rhomboid family serine protease
MPPIPQVTKWLLIVNVALFFIDDVLRLSGTGISLRNFFALYPLAYGFLPWQIVTYAFFHGDLTHLLFNMLGLWVFGSELERLWGQKRYMQFYAAGLLAAAAIQLLLTTLTGSPARTIGASGAIYGLLLGYAMMFPRRRIHLVIPPVELTAKSYALIFGGIELYLGVFVQDGVAHFAHLGGMLGAFLMIRYWRGQPPFKGKRRF